MSNYKLLSFGKLLKGYYIHRRMMQTGSVLSKYMTYAVKDDVAIIKLDDTTSKVNTLSKGFNGEFQNYFKQATDDAKIRSMVIISSKPDCFIAGADVQMLAACKTEDEVEQLSSNGQKDLQMIENSKKPVVAAIMGSCLGGGLEFALACHYRIAVHTKKTVLAFPEVMLGLLPGAGGTQRLPQYCNDYLEAIQMMLTGKNVRVDKAKKLGIVDQLVDSLGPGLKSPVENTQEYLENIAIKSAKQLATGELKRQRQSPSIKQRIVTTLLRFEWGRNLIFGKMKQEVMKLTNGLYPAPLKIIELCKTSAAMGPNVGYELESKYFGQLAKTKEANALFGLFFGRTKCLKNRFGTPKKPAKCEHVDEEQKWWCKRCRGETSEWFGFDWTKNRVNVNDVINILSDELKRQRNEYINESPVVTRRDSFNMLTSRTI